MVPRNNNNPQNERSCRRLTCTRCSRSSITNPHTHRNTRTGAIPQGILVSVFKTGYINLFVKISTKSLNRQYETQPAQNESLCEL